MQNTIQVGTPVKKPRDGAGDRMRRQQVAECLRGILAVLNSNRALEEILDYIVGEARRLLNADAAAIYRLGADEILSIQSAQGLTDTYIARADLPLGQLATGRSVLERRPITLTNVATMIHTVNDAIDPERLELLTELASQFQAVLAVPLITKDRAIGSLTLYYTSPRNFAQEEIDLAVAFCDQSALAIENAKLRERVKEEAINTERSRIARDLHDSVTQMLFSASLISEVLPAVWKRDPGEAEAALDELRQLTRGALAEMRTMLLELRPAGLQNARLEDLLRQLTESLAGRLHAPVRVSIHGAIDLPQEARLALYRIAQEALNNITKHSGATQVEVSLAAEPRGVTLRVWDDGCGFQTSLAPTDHLGLTIMRERAASVGAAISITSQPGAGTEIMVSYPIPQQGSTDEE